MICPNSYCASTDENVAAQLVEYQPIQQLTVELKMNWIDWLQWPAMAVTVFAGWLIASQRKFKRNWGFWLFLLSNVLWIMWGFHDGAYALILLQVCLAVLNVRGAIKNRRKQ